MQFVSNDLIYLWEESGFNILFINKVIVSVKEQVVKLEDYYYIYNVMQIMGKMINQLHRDLLCWSTN